MPDAVIVEVADAVVAVLVAAKASLGITVDATRSYGDVNDELPDLTDLKIDAIPLLNYPEMDAVGILEYPQTIDVLIRKKLGASDQNISDGKVQRAEIDRLLKLTQDIWELFVPIQPSQSGTLTTATGYVAQWEPSATRIMYLFNRQHLKRRQFTGYIRLGYNVSKTLG